MPTPGESVRLSRLFSGGQNAVIVAIDHGLYFGPLPGLVDLSKTVKTLGSADAILMAPGSAEHTRAIFERRGAPAMILRLNWASNYVSIWSYSHSRSVPMVSVAEAVAHGADLVLASLTLRNPDQVEDAQNVELLARFLSEKRTLGIPLVAEVFPTGGDDARREDLHQNILVGCRMAAELGADLVKTFYTGERFEEIAAGSPIPILALGAKKTEREVDALSLAAAAVRAGARGVVFGRNVLQAADPERFLDALKEVVKARADPEKVALRFHLS